MIGTPILQLIETIMRDPFTGMGKPEPLKYSNMLVTTN
jgi:Txe/YoeB family toxin of Txe-Axe toxin-antitoxin module